MDWRDAFTAYTTGMAFHVSLSHDQASLLAAIGDNAWSGWRSRTGRGTFIPAYRSLERRGLAEYNPMMLAGNLRPGVKVKWVYRLTPAGEAVLTLLKLSGVVVHHEIAKDSAAA